MDASSLSAWASELDSKNTKRRLQVLEDLGAALQSQPPRSSSETASGGGLACNNDDNSWQQIVAPLVRTLRDNNFKVCRASLACLESLVTRVIEQDAARQTPVGRTATAATAAAAASGRNGSANSSITPFLSLITPAVVECLGNSKAAVQEKGIDLLLAVSDPAVAGGRDIVSSLQRHFAGHRNWRVRERLVAYLGRVAELDPAGINSIHQQQQQQQRGGVAAETESSLLAGLLADALNDSASQVRQEALAAATRVVGMLAGNGGPILLAQLEAKGVRRVALSALRDAGSGSATGGGGGGETGFAFTEGAAATAGLLSPITPEPQTSFRSGAAAAAAAQAATTVHRAAAAGHGNANGGGARLTTATRRRRPTAAGKGGRGGTTSVLTRAGAGVPEGERGAPTPTGGEAAGRGGGASRAGSPTSLIGNSPRGLALGSGGEESAFSALEPLVAVTVYTERDVRREVEAVKAGLEHESDWQRWVSAMRRLAGVALGGGGSDFPALLVGLVRASVHEMVGHKVSENRSAVAREACRCVAVLARCLTDHFGALAELWLPELLRNTTRAVVVAAAGDEAARAIFGCTEDGFPRLLPYLVDTAKNKSAAIRRRCLDYAMLALARWSDAAFDRCAVQLRDMVAAAVADADSSVRATARRAYWVLNLRFPDLAQSVMGSLAPSMQRHVLREDQEFDAEAFVRAANAAAEDPQFAQRRPASAAFDGEGGLATAAGGAARSSSARVKVDRGAAADSGGGGSGRVLRPGGGAPARRTRPPGRAPAAHDGTMDVADNGNAFSFGAGSAFDAVGGGGGGGDGSKNRSASSALRVAGGGGGGGSEGEVAATMMPATAKSGAFRVPRGGVSETVTRVPAAASGDALHQRFPAARVVARRSSVVPAAGGEGEPQSFDAPGALGGVSKGERGVQPARVVGRQQQQRLDASAVGRREEEAGESRADRGGAMRAVVAAPVVLDRRHVLRQMDDLADQAGASHWGTRTEALESMQNLLTVEGGGGGSSGSDSGERGEGGKFVLESRPASRRVETVIAERTRDVNFRVVAAALKLFGGLVEAHAALMAGHTSTLLPSVFPTLADPKEPVRQAANEALNACRAAYNPNQLCSSLCPRVLELPAGRARTGLLEFLAVLVPHSAVFFLDGHHSSGGGAGGGGHMQSLTQRVASALAQTPPPSNWDGSLGEDGPTSAGPAASAAIRLLTALSRLDREALATASAALPPEPAAAVRRALSFLRPKSPSPPRRTEAAALSPISAGESAVAGGGSAEADGRRSPTTVSDGDGEENGVAAVVTPAVGGVRGVGGKPGDGNEGSSSSSPPPTPTLETPRPPVVAAASPPGEGGFALSSNPGSAFLCEERSGRRGRLEAESALFTPPEQRQQRNPHRQPLAPVTPRDSNRQPAGEQHVGLVSGGSGKNMRLAGFPTPKKSLVLAAAAPASATRSSAVPVAASQDQKAAAEAVMVGGGLIAGLSRGARSHRKIEALSSLRGLADGEGAGGRPDFWPRYFGQVLMLLLEGAAVSPPVAAAAAAGEEGTRRGGGNGGGQGGVYSTPSSRRRSLLRAKHLQGVRCLVARRGEMFPGSTEMVVGRLVEIGGGGGGGGDPSVAVRCEAEACLADLVGVLDPARYLAVLTPLLALLPAAAAAGGGCGNLGGDGGEPKEGLAGGARGVLAQCVALGALRALTPRLSSPGLLGALGAGPLLAGLEAALGGGDLEARKRAVLALVEMYQVLEEALLPFLANFPTNRLKLITMYIEQRRARDKLAAAAAAAAGTGSASTPGFATVKSAGASGAVAATTATRFTPIR
ncbi:OSJNBb0002J11.18 [Ectocarpus siliculosus]|uniref:OSJNBb0002J11.18 n=1 Tax=Ectocarpus siliculosus TaxID=2880 RepID=D7G2M5_ECTSI|nr:OSJNBb0002J11.18 [Ectocarpus siliculosus]|eukprot:CBJ26850.1 OSJNBb0002J11.18 [Ectocarpus siliculosus]